MSVNSQTFLSSGTTLNKALKYTQLYRGTATKVKISTLLNMNYNVNLELEPSVEMMVLSVISDTVNQDFFIEEEENNLNIKENYSSIQKIENNNLDSISYNFPQRESAVQLNEDSRTVDKVDLNKDRRCSFEVVVERCSSLCQPARSLISRPFKKTRYSPVWSEVEKIVFFGVVIFMYCHRHSHKVSVREQEEATRKGSVAWQHISDAFSQAKHRLSEMTLFKNEKRTVSAIQKCWKETKHRESNYNEEPETKKRVRLFDQNLNIDNILLCSKEGYLKKKLELKEIVLEAFTSLNTNIKLI